MKSNYKTMADRIRKCKTNEDVDKCEASIANCYNNGVLTTNETSRLYGLTLDQYVKIEHG